MEQPNPKSFYKYPSWLNNGEELSPHSKRGKAKEALSQDPLEQQTPRYWKARALKKVSLGSANSKRGKATMALKKNSLGT